MCMSQWKFAIPLVQNPSRASLVETLISDLTLVTEISTGGISSLTNSYLLLILLHLTYLLLCPNLTY